MALGPNESLLYPHEKNRADDVENMIDSRMRFEGYDVDGNTIIPVFNLSEKVANELIRRYKVSGWREVEYVGRGGSTTSDYRYLMVFKR